MHAYLFIYMHLSCLWVRVDLLVTMYVSTVAEEEHKSVFVLFLWVISWVYISLGENTQQYNSIACINNQSRKQVSVGVWDFLLTHAGYLALPRTSSLFWRPVHQMSVSLIIPALFRQRIKPWPLITYTLLMWFHQKKSSSSCIGLHTLHA